MARKELVNKLLQTKTYVEFKEVLISYLEAYYKPVAPDKSGHTSEFRQMVEDQKSTTTTLNAIITEYPEVKAYANKLHADFDLVEVNLTDENKG